MTLGATRAVDGHRLILRELQPAPIIAFVESPRAADAWTVGADDCAIVGWAVSSRGRPMSGVLRLGDGTDREFTCDVPRPEVIDLLDLDGVGAACGFEVAVRLPVDVDSLSVQLELTDGEYIIDAEPFRIRRHVEPQLRREAPTALAPLAIYAGEWQTVKDDGTELDVDDARIARGVDALGGVTGARVLDVGAGEALQSVLLERLGASEVVAIEADPATYVRALVVKEVAGLRNTSLRFGNAAEYLRDTSERFDVVVAIDVVHHQLEPAAFLEGLARVSDRLVLWTRCFDGPCIDRMPRLRARFPKPPVERDVRGHPVLVHRFVHDPGERGLARGPDPLGGWLSRDDLVGCLETLGYAVTIPGDLDRPDDPDGPSLLVVASR